MWTRPATASASSRAWLYPRARARRRVVGIGAITYGPDSSSRGIADRAMRSPMRLARPLHPSYFKPCTRAVAGGRKTTEKHAPDSSGRHPAHSKQVSAAGAPDPRGNPQRRQRGHGGARSRVRQEPQTSAPEHSSARWSLQPRQTAGRKKSRSSAASARPVTRSARGTERLPRPPSSLRSVLPHPTSVRRPRHPGAPASPRRLQPESRAVWRPTQTT